MLTSSLIVLCLGLVATCMPTSKSPEQEQKLLNQEIQDSLKIILNNPIEQVFTMASSNLMRPINIPALTKEEQCAMLRLKVFIKLLGQVSIEKEHKLNFQKLCRDLQHFDRLWSSQEPRSHQECETEEYLYRGLGKVLQDLRKLMEQLYCIQGHCQ